MWVFFYKFDEQGWLSKFKIRLIIKNNLQNTDFDIFAAKLFRFLMILKAVFGFQY